METWEEVKRQAIKDFKAGKLNMMSFALLWAAIKAGEEAGISVEEARERWLKWPT